MGMFLNSTAPFSLYEEITKTRFFVDKSAIIGKLISAVMEDGQKYFCLTRPRRFGKSIMACMVGAFFGRAENGAEVFGRLEIAKYGYYQGYLNRYNLISIDFSRLPRDCKPYGQYIFRIQDGINHDLAEAYPINNRSTSESRKPKYSLNFSLVAISYSTNIFNSEPLEYLAIGKTPGCLTTTAWGISIIWQRDPGKC